MTKAPVTPIGELLTAAGLISEGQLQTVLYDQQVYQDLCVGEILATRGWLPKKTVDFFCNVFQQHNEDPQDFLLGQCLLEAGLINTDQIQQILKEQQLNHLRFGTVAVLKGFIAQRTLDFFLEHICTNQTANSNYFQMNQSSKKPLVTFVPKPQSPKPQQPPSTTKEIEINWI